MKPKRFNIISFSTPCDSDCKFIGINLAWAIITVSLRLNKKTQGFNVMIVPTEQPAIIRTERGLTIAGTRITIYDVMDYLKAQYPPKLIREKLGLNDIQVHTALAYIEANHTKVETEYQECLKTAEEIRQYWEERNRERFAKISAMSPKPDEQILRAKLQSWKARIETEI